MDQFEFMRDDGQPIKVMPHKYCVILYYSFDFEVIQGVTQGYSEVVFSESHTCTTPATPQFLATANGLG